MSAEINLLQNQDWTFPVPIVYGPGRLKEIATLCKNAGITRPLIITDRGSHKLPFITDISQCLQQAGMDADLYSEVSPNPRDSEIAAGRQKFRKGKHDGIIGVGGGSGMDGAKAVCLTANNDLNMWLFDYEKTSPDMQAQPAFPPLICIPTTAGTGAETHSSGMITETKRMLKLCIWHPELKPSYALLDPNITVGLPKNLTAWTGCDAMVHAIEGYCVPSFHPLCDGAALEGLRLINTWLPTAVAQPENIQARAGMLTGSCLAGISFLKGLGLVHAISHMVGAEYDTHHGLTNAVVLPAVLRFNASAIADKVPQMAAAMGLKDKSFNGFYAAVCNILDQLDIPKTLAELGLPLDSAAGLAEKANLDTAAGTNPRVATIAEIQTLIEDALTNGR